MRRALDDLAAMVTQIAAGWHLGGDLPRLGALTGSIVVIDVKEGIERVGGQASEVPLELTGAISSWFNQWAGHNQDDAAEIESAVLRLEPELTPPALLVRCETTLHTATRVSVAQDTATWRRGQQWWSI